MIDKEALKQSFSPKNRKKFWVPEKLFEIENINDRKVISWIHKSSHLGFLVNNHNKDMSGIILERKSMTGGGKVCMCDFCLSVYGTSKMAQFTYRRSKTESISYYICDGLDCEDRITSLGVETLHSMKETISQEERIVRYYDRVNAFWNDKVVS